MTSYPHETDHEMFNNLSRALTEVRTWVSRERAAYSDGKFRDHRRGEIEGLKADPHAEEYLHIFHGIGDYLKRAQQFGMNTPQGLQAAGKAMVTIESLLCDSLVAFEQHMPEPGYPSGEIH